MFNKKPKEIELMNEGLIPSIISHQEMLKMGATGALSRAFERYILLDKIEGLDPEPSTWGDGYEFKKGEEIKSSIEVIYDKDRDIYFLQNGNHRIKQARVNGDKYIRAFIQPDNGKIGSDAKLSINDLINEITLNEGYEEIKDVNQLSSDILYSLSYKLNATKTPSKNNPGYYIYEFTNAVTNIEESVNYQKLSSLSFKNFCDKYESIYITFEKGKDGNGTYVMGKKIILFISDAKELEINQELNKPDKNISAKDIYFTIYNKYHSILEHELQHVYDDFISKGQAFNVKQSKDDSKYDYNNFDDVKEYLNLPYEVNARFTQAINKIHFLELVDFTDDNKTVERPIEFKKVLRDFFMEFPHKHLLDNKIKNTIIKRLYNIYNKAIEKAKTDDKIELISENIINYPLETKGNWYGDEDYESRGGKLVYMTPDEFLSKTPTLTIDDTSRDNIDDLKQHILSGRKLDPLALYSSDKTNTRNSDGRHRAIASKELGINKVPVLVFDSKINENTLDYTKSNNKDYELIYVNAEKLLNKLKTDSPEFDITNKDNQIGNRVEKAKEFISNYKDDKRPIHPKTGERIDYLGKHSFEPSVVSFDMNGKLGFTDGRHRVLAAIQSGINKVGIEVPKDQINMFKDLINESNSNTNIICYHTSLNDFNNFDSSKIGSMRNLDNVGFFFTKKEEDAKDFGDLIGRKKQQDFYYLYECSVNLNNPYTFKQFENDYKGEYKTGFDGNLTSIFDLNKDFILNKIKENNCDGLVFGKLVMCLNSNQIKIINKTKIERVIGSMEKYRRQQQLNESNSQLEDTFIKINSPNIKSHVDSLINKYGDKAEVMKYIKYSNEETKKPEYSISYTYCKKLISLATNLKDKHGADKDKFELYGGFPLINYLSKELNNKRDIISRSKKTKTMAGFNHQYNKEHERVGLIKNGKKYVDRNLREHIELIKESEVKVNKEASCIILLNEDKKILLLKRSDKTTWEPGKWSLVGGKIDLGENTEQAAIRECGEETGLGIKGDKLIYCFTMKEDDYEVNFFIGISEGNDVRLNGEHTEYKWVSPNEILELETVPNLLGEIKKGFESLAENKETDVNESASNIDNKTQDQLYKLFQKLNKQYVKLDKELDNTKDSIESEKISEKLEEIQELMSKISAKMENDNINENIINEKLTNVDTDVDMLYYKYFKIDIDEIQRTGIVRKDMFKTFQTSTNTLTSEEAIKGNEINPCRIIINNNSYSSNNFYKPSESLIVLSINKNAVDYCLEDFNGNVQKAALSLPTEQYNQFLKEFTEDRIKGTIHHELAHWLDDTFNNQHLTKRIELQTKLNTRDLNGIPVNTTKMEIQGQIHNIKQLYNKYKNEWDNWTLNDVFKNIPSLTLIAKNLQSKPEIRKQWLRDLITRMNREGLLGKNMRINNNINETVINEEDYKISHKAPNEDNSPMFDITDTYPDDIYGPNAVKYYSTGYPAADNKAIQIIKQAKGKPEQNVTIYRAVPNDPKITEIQNNWVTITPEYANEHGKRYVGDYKILKKVVKAKNLFTDGNSIQEWGYIKNI